jgi:adenine-specific DNA-methyltransferase
MTGKKTTTPGEEPEKLDLRSLDVAAERRAELLRLFPEARTEGGKVDFARLQAALGEMIDGGRERYSLTWPGKADCFKTIQAPSLGTLRPAPEESVNFDRTENLIIEGDNLEVLKLLQKSYLGRVKMIYIDPPYNTGNDFIYPDNYGETLQTYLQYTGQVDAEGRRFGTNTETDGRFHSKWLNMMYPRLYVARNLLREDGYLIASIDDDEFANAERVLDEIWRGEPYCGACF